MRKKKHLDQFQLHKLIETLNLGQEINNDYMIYLVAKTGLRFSEALALTPSDFDFERSTLNVDKTWDYKSGGGFKETKTKGSKRRIPLDWQTMNRFSVLIRNMDKNKPIFVPDNKILYNATINDQLERHCKDAGIPTVSVHSLRHTHASILFYSGASIASVSRRLGHADVAVTEKTYLHIIKELEGQDNDVIMRSMSVL